MDDCRSLATGVAERIGEPMGRLKHSLRSDDGESSEVTHEVQVADHREGLKHITTHLSESGQLRDPRELAGIGHRVVHGGEAFRQPTLLKPEVLDVIRKQFALAPLHNPPNLLGINVTLEACPNVPQVAVFDTAFHQTIPRHAFLYAIPYEYYEKHGIRRYGFHGTSHHYVAKKAAEHLHQPFDSLRLITIHLGNGASAAAIDHGQCVDTSMGLTPLEGLIMGTRCGDVDPAILPILAKQEDLSMADLETVLNKKSGLQGICDANDMREILVRAEEGDDRAELAINMFAYRIKKYVGAYLAALGGADAIIFTAGIGENSPQIRQRACANLTQLGLEIDPQKNVSNEQGVREIQTDESAIRVLVVPTDEEFEIAQQTLQCIGRSDE